MADGIIDKLLADHLHGHSDFQMDYFITGKGGPTTYGMYRQALRELVARHKALKRLEIKRQMIELDIDQLQQQSDGCPIKQRRRDLEIQLKRLELEDILTSIHTTRRELDRFYTQAVALKERLGDIDDTRRHELEREMWVERAKLLAIIDLATAGRLSPASYEMIIALPPADRTSIVKFLTDKNAVAERAKNGYQVERLLEDNNNDEAGSS